MDKISGVIVFWILVPLFMAVGLYLFWYTRCRRKMLEASAQMHQFRVRPEYAEALQKTLDSCFSMNEEGLVRRFGQLSNLALDELIIRYASSI